ncbi:MAG: hypothetical protein WBA39_22955 [Rivularia sp. (in: cyanobacteria)]
MVVLIYRNSVRAAAKTDRIVTTVPSLAAKKAALIAIAMNATTHER